jgi:hypothetical protein
MRKTTLACGAALVLAAAAPARAAAPHGTDARDRAALSAQWRAAPVHRRHARPQTAPAYAGHPLGPGPYPYGPNRYGAAPLPFFPYFGYGWAW